MSGARHFESAGHLNAYGMISATELKIQLGW